MSGKLTVDIIEAEALTPDLCGLWRGWADHDPALAGPYFRPEFTQIAARVSPQSAIAVFSRGGRTVGFFPFQRRGGAIQPIAAPMKDYHGVIAAPGETIELTEVARLLKAGRLNVGSWVGPAHKGDAVKGYSTVLPESGFDCWYEERRTAFGKYFKDKERARRSMEVEFGPIRVETGLKDADLLEQLIALKREQYRRTRRHDIFACGWTVELLRALMRDGEGDFGGSMAALWAGDRLCALEYSLYAGDHCHFWFPAYVPAMARCSPGILLTLDTMQKDAAEGRRVFDFGFGGEAYKKYFCNTTRSVREAVVVRPGLGEALSQTAMSMLNLAGEERAERLRVSVRRRWAAVEACEVTHLRRLQGAAFAAQTALEKLSRNAA